MHADSMAQFLEGGEVNHETNAPTTGGGSQVARPQEILPGGPLTNSPSILTSSNLQGEKNLENISGQTQILEYSPALAEHMYQWFISKPKFRIIVETAYWKNGEQRTKEVLVPNAPPHLSEYAREIGTTERTLKRWAKQHEEFGESLEACQAIIKEFLIDNGLLKNYDPSFAKFAATNLTDMKDKTQHTVATLDLNKILDKAAKSSSPFEDIDI